jgi:hypothetical protein
MRRIVFYAWQSDLPNATNRGFIQKALENVAAAITADDGVDIEPVIDRDTQGIAGAPDIAKTIFQKIATADVLVADISIIGGQPESRVTPNPNVLVELGYALHALGDERVVLVFNTAYARFEQLPFDLKMRRAIPYCMPASATDRATERKVLEGKLDLAIRTALASVKSEPPKSLLTAAIDAIEHVVPNRLVLVRRFLSELLTSITAKRPKSVSTGVSAADLEAAVLQTEDIALDYARLADAIAIMSDAECARALYRGFGPILEQYDIPQGMSGTIYTADFDFVKFLGHELFTILIACLVRENRWEIIAGLLAEGIPVKYRRSENGPGVYSFDEISEHLAFCTQLNQERRRLSVHADILKARYDPDRPLGRFMPMDDFMAADYFLFLRGDLLPEATASSLIAWRPWSTLFLKSAPLFIREAESFKTAKRIAAALALPDVEVFRQRLEERAPRLAELFRGSFWDQPLRSSDIKKIGTRS